MKCRLNGKNNFFSQLKKIEQKWNPSLISLHIYKELPKSLKQWLVQLKGFILKLNWVISVSYYLSSGPELVNQVSTTLI